MAEKGIDAVVTAAGLAIGDHLFKAEVGLEEFRDALGMPDRTIAAGPPAPVGHRNNQVHFFDSQGIYLTEHHASRLIESVSFVFDRIESPFSTATVFSGRLTIEGQHLHLNMRDRDLDSQKFSRVLGGMYNLISGSCWIGVSTQRKRNLIGKRSGPRYVNWVSIGFPSHQGR